MTTRHLLALIPVALAFAACQSAVLSQADAKAVDLHNTKCVVTGDPIDDSKLQAVYEGKVYHFCCSECPDAFKKDPAKYAKLVAADPAKYGVKQYPSR